MKTLLHTLLSLILTTLISHAENLIHLELRPTTCLPGDLVELTATSTSPTYQEFSLNIPKNKNLQLIAKETSPVALQEDHYTQTTLYIFQAIAPGQHTLSNITANSSNNNTDKPLTIPLEPLTLTVSTYPTLDLDPAPASYPVTTTHSPTPLYYWLLLLIPALVIALLLIKKKNTPPPALQTPTPPSLETLKQELAKGTLPEPLCILLLEQKPNTLSTKTTNLIQQALYKPTFTASDLLKSLIAQEQEDRS